MRCTNCNGQLWDEVGWYSVLGLHLGIDCYRELRMGVACVGPYHGILGWEGLCWCARKKLKARQAELRRQRRAQARAAARVAQELNA